MAKIRNVTLTPELTTILINMIKDAPDDLMCEIARRCIKGGFTNPEATRQRLCVILESSAPLEPWFVALVRCGLTARPVVKVFSAEALRSVFEPLAALGGRTGLLLAALFDECEDIHKVGAEMMAKEPPAPAVPDFEAKKCALIDWVDNHILKFANIALLPRHGGTGGGAGNPDAPEAEVNVAELMNTMEGLRRIAEGQKKTIDNLRRGTGEQSRKQQTRLDAAAKRAADEKKKIVAEREEARRQVLRLQKERGALTARLDELSAAHQTVISKGVEENTSVIVRKWLAAPVETERAVGQLNGSDLLTRAEQALEAQARQDRLTGNRVELERQLTRLRETRERLHSAATTALCPIPQLRELLTELDAQIARTEKTLNGRRSADPLTDKLLVSINHAATWDDARQTSALVDQLVEADLVPAEDRRRLFDGLQRKFSLLDETSRAQHGAQRDHGWSLRDAVFRNQPSLLLLDGHNILFGLEDVFRPHYDENGRPGRAARDRLVQFVRRLLDGRDNLQARICFDAPQHEVITISPSIAIEFSGGRGEHRADQRIADHVAWRRPDQLGQTWFVITDDRAVRREALKNGARYVPIDLFAVLLNDFNCMAPAPLVAA